MTADGAKHKPLLYFRHLQPESKGTYRTTVTIGVRDEHCSTLSFLIGLAGWQKNFHAVGQVSQVLKSHRHKLRPAHSRSKSYEQ